MRFFFFALILLGAAGTSLWWVSTQPWAPPVLQAKMDDSSVSVGGLKDQAQQVDAVLAQTVRNAADGTLLSSELFPADSWKKLQSATVSAQLQTSPQELWRSLREEGAQAVLSDLATQTAVSVNGVSTQVLNEARYQYCLGVVQQYEQR